MFCFINRWLISWSLDSPKPFPGAVKRHIRRCENCREFARASGVLDAGLSREIPGFPRESHEALETRIISTLSRNSPPGWSPRRRFTIKPLPGLAVALIIVAVAMGIVFRVIPWTSTPEAGSTPVGLAGPGVIKIPFERLASGVESPMEKEIHSLRQSISSATGFLISCLDVNIGQH
jgi:hypothetical protein